MIAGSTARVGNDGVSARRLASSSATAFAIHIIGAGMTYASQVVIARVVGAGSFGIYSYVMAWTTILAYLSALGFDVSLLRLVSVYRRQQSWTLLRGVIRYAELRAICVGLGVAGVGSIIILLFHGKQSPELRHCFLAGFLIVPVWALLWIRSSIVRACGGVVSALAPDRMLRDGLLLVLVSLVSATHLWPIDATGATLAALLSSVVGLGVVTFAAMRWTHGNASVRPEYSARIWRRTALPLVLLAVGEAAMNRTGVVLLGWTAHTTDAGVYALAFNISSLMVLPRTGVNAMFAPLVADLYSRGDRPGLQDVITRTSLWTLFGALAIALPLALFAEPLLGWFGPEFISGATALRMLLAGQMFAAAAGSQLYLMTMTGHERQAASLLVTCAIGGFGMSLLLIHLIGLGGAAIAAAMTVIAWNGAMAIFIRYRLALVPGILPTVGGYR